MARRRITSHDLEQRLGEQLRRPPLSEIRGDQALLRAIVALKSGDLAVATLQSYSQKFEGRRV